MIIKTKKNSTDGAELNKFMNKKDRKKRDKKGKEAWYEKLLRKECLKKVLRELTLGTQQIILFKGKSG